MPKQHFDVYSGSADIKNGMGVFTTVDGHNITASVEKIDGNRIETREFVFNLIEAPDTVQQPKEQEDDRRDTDAGTEEEEQQRSDVEAPE